MKLNAGRNISSSQLAISANYISIWFTLYSEYMQK